MKKQLDAVKLFHDTFGVKQSENQTLLDEDTFILRHKLMAEENQEYLMACAQDDMVEIADALGDQLYILCGTIQCHGLQHVIEKVFDEIQRSNMSKLGADGKPIYREDGKVMKGEGYTPPNIKSILDNE